MSSPASGRSEFLENLLRARREWDDLLSWVTPEQFVRPGACGEWSVKDVVMHVTALEQWLVILLRAALKGRLPPPSIMSEPDVDRQNAHIFQRTQHLTPEEVSHLAAHNFADLVELVQQLPENELHDAARTVWFVEPYWKSGTTLAQAISDLTVEHYQEHLPGLREWVKHAYAH